MPSANVRDDQEVQTRCGNKLEHHAIFLFYNAASGVQSHLAFSRDKVHCDVMLSDGRGWVAFQFTSRGIAHRIMRTKNAARLLHAVKSIPELTHYVTLGVYDPPKHLWLPWIANSCNEICRKLAMIDCNWTFNPAHLYSKLIALDGKRNFQIISKWSRE